MTLKEINSKLEIIDSQKETPKSRFLEVEAQKEHKKEKITSSTQAIMEVENHIQSPENWSVRNNHQFISILKDSEREYIEELIENITPAIL